jgi:hypothetical protein
MENALEFAQKDARIPIPALVVAEPLDRRIGFTLI